MLMKSYTEKHKKNEITENDVNDITGGNRKTNKQNVKGVICKTMMAV